MKWFEMMECRSSKSNIHQFWRMEFLLSSFSDIGKYFWILNIDSIKIFQIFEMSSYLIHSRMFDRNQFRVLFDWFDFIHRCCFHSRWSCQNRSVIPSLDLHTSFHSTSLNEHWIFNAYSVCLFQTPYHHSLVIDLGSNHWLTLFHHFITTQIGLASMFQSFV